MIFDTHAHYDDEQFNEDRVELLNSMEEQGVGTIVNVSAAYNSCRKVIALAKEYPFVYAAVGIHPDEVGCLNEENFAQMKELFKEEKVVAVGEIGLDYYWDNEPREVQKKWFIRQLELARELDLPVLIHSREAAEDTMEIMKEHAANMKAIITVVGKDRTGIVAGVSTKIAELGLNIDDITQTVLDEYFTMMAVVSSQGSQDFAQLRKEFEAFGETLNVKINIQSSAIFDAMHNL